MSEVWGHCCDCVGFIGSSDANVDRNVDCKDCAPKISGWNEDYINNWASPHSCYILLILYALGL